MSSFVETYRSLVEAKEVELLVESIKDAILEVNKDNKDTLTEQEVNDLVDLICEDEELLVEFLGQLAGFLGKKLGSAGSSLQAYSGKQRGLALKKKYKAEKLKAQKSSRAEHSAAIQAYMKALKGGDHKTRSKAYSAMKLAQQKSLASRGINLKNTSKSFINKKGKIFTPNSVHKEYRRKWGIKEFKELILLAAEQLNEQREA